MKCQEHNRSKNGTLRGKNTGSDAHDGSKKKSDICSRRQITYTGNLYPLRFELIQKSVNSFDHSGKSRNGFLDAGTLSSFLFSVFVRQLSVI